MIQHFFLLGLFLLASYGLQAQCNGNQNLDLYWRGGSGNFTDLTQWDVGSLGSNIQPCQAPRTGDNIFFMAAAFNGGGLDTIFINNNIASRNVFFDDAISLADMPRVESAGTNFSQNIYWEINGSFELSTNLDFVYNGNLRFINQTNGVVPITTRGNKLLLWTVIFQGGANTVFELQDDLYVDDVRERNHAGNTAGRTQGVIQLRTGIFNTNEHNVRADYFDASVNTPDRGLDISNSVIDIHGSYPYVPNWRVSFNTNTSNYSLFDATGSKIHIHTYSNNPFRKIFSGSFGLAYDTLICDPAMSIRGQNTFNEFYLYDDATFYSSTSVEVPTIHLSKGHVYYFGNAINTLIIDSIARIGNCDQLITLDARKEVWSNTQGVIRKRTPGVLTTDYLILKDMQCDTTGGRSYISNNTIEIGTVDPWWVINPPTTGNNWYFRDRSGDQTWSNPINWDVKVGASFIPNTGNCLPGVLDNVYFDGASFPNAAKRLQIDEEATCHDMRWLPTVDSAASFNISATFNTYGSVFLDPDMNQCDGPTNIYWFLHGNDPDTLSFAGVRVWTVTYIRTNGEYEIIGDTDPNTMDFHIRYLYGLQGSILHTNNVQLKVQRLYLSNRYMDSTQVYFDYNLSRFADYGGIRTYTGNTTFYFNAQAPNQTCYMQQGLYPNVVTNCNMILQNAGCTIEGDLVMNGDANVVGYVHNSHVGRLNVTGTMALYDGNVTLAKGKTYRFSPNLRATVATGSYFFIAGSLTAIGDCQSYVNIRTINGSPIPIRIGDIAGSTLDYVSLTGFDNTGNPTILLSNSIDGGNNTNFNFTAGAVGNTYYWRAHKNDPTDFVGVWSDVAHWTTNPANLVGDSACSPNLLDTVIFDNLSFSPTSNGCTIEANSFCKTLICRADIQLDGVAAAQGSLFIGQSIHLHNAMTNFRFSGLLYFIGSGTIEANNTPFRTNLIYFDAKNAVWDLASDIDFSLQASANHGRILFHEGTLRTNDYNLSANILTTGLSRAPATWDFGTSTINIYGISNFNSYVFGGTYMDSLQVDADSCVINIRNRQNSIYRYRFSPNIATGAYGTQYYKEVNFSDIGGNNRIEGGLTHFGFLNLAGDMQLSQGFTCDSIFFQGGYRYRLRYGATFTLSSPNGKIITDAGPGAFATIESSAPGTPSFFHKAYGNAFCLDYVRVQDNIASKDPIASVPPAYQLIHPLLTFETGANSDNVNGTATGIWDFSLPVLVKPTVFGDTIVDICAYADTQMVPVPLIGNSPYIVSYTWTDNLGNTGSVTDSIFADSDGDDNTPFTYYIPYPMTGANSVSYNLEIATYRCGEETDPTYTTMIANVPSPNILVAQNRTDTCYSPNSSQWLTFLDDVDERPILSIQDQISGSDTDSLGLVAIEVDFDPTVQYLGATPYLQRHWVIEPEYNHAANVRFYFTQVELDSLRAHTFHASAGLPLNPAFDIQVRKFESGIIGVGPSTLVPHTVIPWTPASSSPFITTANTWAIEVPVPSFSAFIIEPTNLALLPTELISFEATLADNRTVTLDWAVEQDDELAYFILERAKDGLVFKPFGQIDRATPNGLINYTFVDDSPFPDRSYYRLKLVDKNGSFSYSSIETILLEGMALMDIFPNPVRDELQAYVLSNQAETLTLEVVDQLGRVVLQQQMPIDIGQQRLSLPTATLSAGIYLLRVTNSQGQVQQKRFTVTK